MQKKSVAAAIATVAAITVSPLPHADALSSFSGMSIGSSDLGSSDFGSSFGQDPEKQSDKDIIAIASRADELNKRYAANDYDGEDKPDSIYWKDRTDTSKIVIVAPHATNHHRDGKPKPADKYTGAMAEVLGERLGASVLTTTGEVSDWGDTWDGRDDEFTRVLHGLPKDAVIIDLHGMSNSSSQADLSLGTGEQPNDQSKELAQRIRDEFVGDTVIDHKYTAEDEYTVTDHMQKRGHTVVQVEVSEEFRNPDKYRVAATIRGLERALAKTADE